MPTINNRFENLTLERLQEIYDILSSSPPGAAVWGAITGTLSSQLDLQAALNLKYDASNPAGYITSASLSGYLTIASAVTTYYPLTNPAGYTSNTGTVTSVAALTIGTSGTDLNSTVANGTTTPTITLNVPTASASNRGVLSTLDWTTFNNKQNALSLTTTGTSGPATLVGSTLNIPQYSGGGGGVTQILAGTNITISPAGGTGIVTINASGGGGSSTDAIAYAIALG